MESKGKQVVTMPVSDVQSRIHVIRGQRVIIDADLAILYGVPTKRLNEQVKRNAERFPEDFAFRLTREELQEVVANCDHLGHLKYSPNLPTVFTEHGSLMAASVLNSARAVQVSVHVVRAFVQLRYMASEVAALAKRLDSLEQETSRRFQDHDGKLQAIFQTLRDLLTKSQDPTITQLPSRRPIGFRGEKK
jgi:hypothetical protein